MEVTLAPSLSDLQKSMLRDWLIGVLNDAELNSRQGFPLSGYVSVYVNKRPAIVRSGSWVITSESIYLANSDLDCPLIERLFILLTLSQLCEPSEELTKACSGAITRYLLGEYRSLSSNLIVSTVTPSGIAFSCDNRIASLLGNEWMLSSGEPVDVSGPDWVVCASVVPAAPIQEIAVDTQFNAAPFGPAFPPTQDESPTRQFRVGDRVSYTQIPGVVRAPDFYETGVVELANYEGELELEVRSDQTTNAWSFGSHIHLLTLIEPSTNSEYQFSVGQRVHWTPSPEDTISESDGTILELPMSEFSLYHKVQLDRNDEIILAIPSELRAI